MCVSEMETKKPAATEDFAPELAIRAGYVAAGRPKWFINDDWLYWVSLRGYMAK